MCGIFGALATSREGLQPRAIVAATRAIRNRGPDDEGYVLINPSDNRSAVFGGTDTQAGLELPPMAEANAEGFPLAFAFRRLSILDLSIAGHQPMSSDDSRLWMVFNGEIYNYVEIAKELTELGHQFKSSGDSEVFLAAYKEWGCDCFKRFVGMWGGAIWDGNRRQLVLTRDPFGIKPLYFCHTDTGVVFGSELKCLLAFGVRKVVDPQGLYNYIRTGRPGLNNGSIIRGVRQIPPGHYAQLDLSGPLDARERPEFKSTQYWQPEPKTSERISFSSAAEMVREAFLTSIRQHLRSDVPVAVNLSGGIDSSAVLMSARKILGPDVPIDAFSFIANEKFLSEERWVDLVANAAGARVNKVCPTSNELTRDIEALVVSQDEPIGSISPYAQYRVFKLAHDNAIKVTLDGQGADEYLAGYVGYFQMRLASLIRKGQPLSAARFSVVAGGKSPINTHGLIKAAMRISGTYAPTSHTKNSAQPHIPLGTKKDYFYDYQVVDQQQFVAETDDVLRENLIWTLTRSSLPELLRFVDRNSMSFSIESRVPFLTPALVDTVLSLPEEYILSADGLTKNVFRSAMRGIVPSRILDRKDKIGFTVPEFHWLRQVDDWITDALDDSRIDSAIPVSGQLLREEWVAAKRGLKGYNQMVWRWANCIVWAERHDAMFS